MSGVDVGGVRTLKRGAALMREQHGPGHKRHAMWTAMADLIHEVASAHYPLRASENNYPYGCATCFPNDGDWPCGVYIDALTVARTYLGEDV